MERWCEDSSRQSARSTACRQPAGLPDVRVWNERKPIVLEKARKSNVPLQLKDVV
jgi:hypothetical protein